jgi:uncharacterized protein (TIGR02466 family)
MSKLIHLFPLSIFQTSVTLAAEERQRLGDAILEMGRQRRAQTAPGVAWTGDLNGHELLHNDPRFAALFAAFAQPLNEYLQAFSINPQRLQLYFTRSWGTISRQGESTQGHSHMQSHISLVYYLLKPPGSSGLAFVEKNPPNQFAPNLFNPTMLPAGVLSALQPLNTQKFNLEPQQDDVIIFPSRAVHEIPRNPDAGVRISIACDIVATVRDSKGLEYLLPQPELWKPVG